VYAGVDIGSVTSKAVITNERDEVIASAVVTTSPDRLEGGRTALDKALELASLGRGQIKRVVATGYGRRALSDVDRVLPEIICHARGTVALFPGVRTIIDIGGQDSKVIEIDPAGRPMRFGMNDKCAAGTGRFLEVTARVLGLDLEDLGQVSLRSVTPCSISSVCTVFAESEIVSLLSEGKAKEDIASGLHYAIARRVINMGTASQIKYFEPIVFSGGVAHNVGVVKAIQDVLKKKVIIPVRPQITAALGASIFAREDTNGPPKWSVSPNGQR
jgi:predicted CoA-substrate-specific enzyme activase